MTEIEIRAVIDKPLDLQKKLIEWGFEATPEFEQLDMIFDKPDASLFKSGQKIRIRIEKGVAILTYKGYFQGDPSASRRAEIDIPINPDLVPSYITLFEAIGYPICFQIPKKRKTYKKDNVIVTFDNWPIIGCLVEIEGEESSVKLLASQLAPGIEFRNYRLKELFVMKEQETGQPLSQLKVQSENMLDISLGKIEVLLD